MAVCFNICRLGLFVLDFIFVLIGLFAITTGIWTAVDSSSFFETIAFLAKAQPTVVQLYAGTEIVKITAAVLITIGSIMFLLSFCGCWGVVSENEGLLITYTTVMSLIVLTEIICTILLFTLNSQWQPKLHRAISSTFSKSYKGTLGAFSVTEFDPFSFALDSFMIKFECCGINGPADFASIENSTAWHHFGRTFRAETKTYRGDEVLLPVACCQFNSTDFFVNQQFNDYLPNMVNKLCPTIESDYHTESCLNVIPQKLKERRLGLILAPVLILLLELVCIGLAAYLVAMLRRWRNELFY